MSQELTKENEDNLLIKLFKKINIDIDGSLSKSSKGSSVLNLTIDEIYLIMNSKNEIIQIQAIQACRKMLNKESTPLTDEVISKGIVSLCIEFLKPQYSSKLQLEACWLITNVAAGTSEHTQYIINQGAVPLLVELLKSSSADVVELAVWALRNIAGNGPMARDLVLQEEALPLLIQLVKPETSISFAQIIVGTLLNLFRHKNPKPLVKLIKEALPLFNRLLNYSDEDILANTCWALRYFSDGSNEHIQAVIECGVVPKLIKLLASQDTTVLAPALQTVGNIASGNNSQTDTVVAHGALPFLRDLLYHKEVGIVKEAAWVISNITAGTIEQIQQVIDAEIITPLILVMQKHDFRVQKEAAWAISNMTDNGTVLQIAHLFDKKILEPFCDLLMLKDENCVLAMLDCIKRLLTTAEKIDELDRVALIIKKVGGLNNLKTLQKHENFEIKEKATSIINLYFSKTNGGIARTTNTEGQLEYQSISSKENLKSEKEDIYTPY